MAGHAQLKFVMTECSKTQIRLTGLIYLSLFGLLECLVMLLTLTLEIKIKQRNISNKVSGNKNSVKFVSCYRRQYHNLIMTQISS